MHILCAGNSGNAGRCHAVTSECWNLLSLDMQNGHKQDWGRLLVAVLRTREANARSDCSKSAQVLQELLSRRRFDVERP